MLHRLCGSPSIPLSFILALVSVMLLCICVGSVSIPLRDTLTAMWNTLWGLEVPKGISKNIILNVRLPRVINVALVFNPGICVDFGFSSHFSFF